jgi:hypothetical protein
MNLDEQKRIQDAKSETTTLILSNVCNRNMTTSNRAKAIRKCAKSLGKKTKNKALKDACRMIRNTKEDGKVIYAIERAEYRFFDIGC